VFDVDACDCFISAGVAHCVVVIAGGKLSLHVVEILTRFQARNDSETGRRSPSRHSAGLPPAFTPTTDYVDLGVVGPGVCSITQAIALDFQMPDPKTIDDNDTLIRVELRWLNWGCM